VNHPNEDQQISLYESLEMFTKTAAWSAFEEKDKGTIVSGKLADLVVLSDDPFTVDSKRIADIKIELVFVAGRPQLQIPTGNKLSGLNYFLAKVLRL